jgi:hypothetical protein
MGLPRNRYISDQTLPKVKSTAVRNKIKRSRLNGTRKALHPVDRSGVQPSARRTALQRDRCLPSSVVGLVLFVALRRLAGSCLSEVIGGLLDDG